MKLKTKQYTKTFLVEQMGQIDIQWTDTMASNLVNEDNDDNGNITRTTHQQHQQHWQQHSQCNSDIINNNDYNSSTNNNNNVGRDVENLVQRRQALEQRKQNLDKLLNEKSWLLQQIQKQEIEILNGNFHHLNLNDFVQSLATQYKQELCKQSGTVGDTTIGFDNNACQYQRDNIQLRFKSLPIKESILVNSKLNNNTNSNYNSNNCVENQSDISNRSSEYDNFPNIEINQTVGSTKQSSGSNCDNADGSGVCKQYPLKTSVKKRSDRVVNNSGPQFHQQGNIEKQQQSNIINRQRQLANYNLQQQTKQQEQSTQHQQQHQQHQQQQQYYIRQPHQVLLPHLQCATQKFYYATLYAQPQLQVETQPQCQSQAQYVKSQMPQTYITTPSIALMDNISLYSVNSTNVATKHSHPHPQHQHEHHFDTNCHKLQEQSQQQQQQQPPIIVQCEKYYLSPTYQPNQNDGGGFIKSSQNIKQYISPVHSPQHINNNNYNITSNNISNSCGGVLRVHNKSRSNQQSLQRVTPSLDIISLAPSYLSMEEATIDCTTDSPTTSSRSMTNNLNIVNTTSSNVQNYVQHSTAINNNLNNQQKYTTALPGKYNNHYLSNDTNLQTIENNERIYSTQSIQNQNSNRNNDKHINSNQYYSTAFQPPPPTPSFAVDTAQADSYMTKTESYDNNIHNHNVLNNNNTLLVGSSKLFNETSSPVNHLSNTNSENSSKRLHNQQQPKAKQWLESSLDGPVTRHNHNSNNKHNNNSEPGSHRLIIRKKLSSQSMHTITTRPYTTADVMSTGNDNHHYLHHHCPQRTSIMNSMGTGCFKANPLNYKTLNNDTYYYHQQHNNYNKLSQSTSHLNHMGPGEIMTALTTTTVAGAKTTTTTVSIASTASATTKSLATAITSLSSSSKDINELQSEISNAPRQVMITIPSDVQKVTTKPITTTALYVNTNNYGGGTTNLSPDIRIESPKNVTIVQPATFQPYKEITKPFEMSDFYKYSTKFRQKDTHQNQDNPN